MMSNDICGYCNTAIEDLCHFYTPDHINNELFYNYVYGRTQLIGNNHGIVVSCDAESATENITDYTYSNIILSVKTDEAVKFKFTVLNETSAADILFVGVHIPATKEHFIMNDHPYVLGKDPHRLSPNETVLNNICVEFSSPACGQSSMRIMFVFLKTVSNEIILVLKYMMVFVEPRPEPQEAPVPEEEVDLDVFAAEARSLDDFRIPQGFTAKSLHKTIVESFEEGVTEMNYSAYFHNLLWYEEYDATTSFWRYNMSAQHLRLKPDGSYELTVPGLAEKRPSLVKGGAVNITAINTTGETYDGKIIALNENEARLEILCNEFRHLFDDTCTFDIAFVMNRVPLERMHVAVEKLNEVGQICRVFPTANPETPYIAPIDTWFNPLIGGNSEQRRAVEHIVSGSAGAAPYILHGPPGTGKTVTIVEAILQLLLQNDNNRILVCTESNSAADHVACSLLQYKHIFDTDFLLRAHSKARHESPMPKELAENAEQFPFSKELFDMYRIVVTTLSHAALYQSSDSGITHLFIDEAGQASEPACLVPVTSLLGAAGAMVLAGDHKQLGPVVMSHVGDKRGLSLSLMERLMDTNTLYQGKDPRYTVMLRQNYRSHPEILDIPNNLFYDNQVIAHAAPDPLSTTDILGDAKTCRAVVFHGCNSTEQKMGKSPSYSNEMELSVVNRYISALVQRHHVLPKDIGVVTPYHRQAHLVKTWLSENELSAIEVGTVEAFQGKEKRVIIISTVRANSALLDHDARFQLGFLVDDKRFNVALTRAKAKLIIIGNPLCLQLDDKWKMFMSKCRRFNTYVGFDPVIEPNPDVVEELVEAARAG